MATPNQRRRPYLEEIVETIGLLEGETSIQADAPIDNDDFLLGMAQDYMQKRMKANDIDPDYYEIAYVVLKGPYYDKNHTHAFFAIRLWFRPSGSLLFIENPTQPPAPEVN